MAYLPKNTVDIKESKGEFIFKNSGRAYLGPYIATNSGRYFSGRDTQNLGPELVKKQQGSIRTTNTKHVNKLLIIKGGLKQKVNSQIDLIPSKNIPTEEDYKNRFFRRYFVIKNNDPTYLFEINKKQYKAVTKDNRTYDKTLYTIGVINWALDKNVIDQNFKTLEKLKRKTNFHGVTKLFGKLNEFEKEPEIERANHIKYNIKGRYYPNGMEVPSNLPPTYKTLANSLVKKCQGCKFYFPHNSNTESLVGKCNYWNAIVKNQYWCQSFKASGISPQASLSYEEYQQSLLSNENPTNALTQIRDEMDTNVSPTSVTSGGFLNLFGAKGGKGGKSGGSAFGGSSGGGGY